MRAALGLEEAPESQPAKKAASRKRAAKKLKPEDMAEGAAIDEGMGNVPKKRTRKPRTPADPSAPKTAGQLRKEADRAIALAERAEHKEQLAEARADVRFQESLIKEHQKGLTKAEKELEKAKARLAKMEGPGE